MNGQGFSLLKCGAKICNNCTQNYNLCILSFLKGPHDFRKTYKRSQNGSSFTPKSAFKNLLRKDKFLQCLQIFLQALQKILNALQIFGNRTPIFRHADKKNPASRITTTYRKNDYKMCRFFFGLNLRTSWDGHRRDACHLPDHHDRCHHRQKCLPTFRRGRCSTCRGSAT